jgi:hypothetical protein
LDARWRNVAVRPNPGATCCASLSSNSRKSAFFARATGEQSYFRNCSASSRMLDTWAIWSSSPRCTGNARSSPAIGSNHAIHGR